MKVYSPYFKKSIIIDAEYYLDIEDFFQGSECEDGNIIDIKFSPKGKRKFQLLLLQILERFDQCETLEDYFNLDENILSATSEQYHSETLEAVQRHGSHYWQGDDLKYIMVYWQQYAYDTIIAELKDYCVESKIKIISSKDIDEFQHHYYIDIHKHPKRSDNHDDDKIVEEEKEIIEEEVSLKENSERKGTYQSILR